MTTDPERLLHAVGTEPAERELLASVRDVHAPGGAKERVWSGIAGELAAGVMVGTVAGTAAATSTATAK
ncbi:MAG TPA: hypothetical protein VFZ53_32315, partial [Polyangiaceae bacterium]